MTVEAHKETLGFQTEVRQLLKLMIHSLYSNKEIFLRELISNASDASDKLRFEALSDNALYEDDGDLKIQVEFDKDARTLTIRDNGIGMSREEVMENIGTIARSGTRQFFEGLTGDQAKDAQLIGQFGVGFYSAFIVADKVTVATRRAGMTSEHGVVWESDGEGEYSIETVDKVTRGTEITLHLREGEEDFANEYRLNNVIRKYSDHISLPIFMKVEKTSEAEEGEEPVTTLEWDAVNSASALWTRAKNEISDEEYSEFYKHVAHDYQEPLAHVHSKVEGNNSYTSLFYVPKHAPFDLHDREKRQGIKLYVKRVFIMDEAEHMMPAYLRFVKGIVDSDDLPLNVSREILQRNKHIDSIRGASVKKILGLLEGLSKNEAEKYAEFWTTFGTVLKEGVAEDNANRERIAKLMRFASTHNNDDMQNVSLDDYISRMKEGQDKIYYITADSYAAAKNSPHLEVFLKKGIEVLLMGERVDEWMMSYLSEFDAKPMQSVAKGDLDLGELDDEESKEEAKKVEENFKDLATRMKDALSEQVKEVRVSHRLTRSPSCLVVEEQDMALNMQKLLKQAGHDMPTSQPTLEINPDHPLVSHLKTIENDETFKDWSCVLLDQATLSEGGQLDDPANFVVRLNGLLLSAMGKAEVKEA